MAEATKKSPVDTDRVLELVGGVDNIADVFHCQTRLRFTLRDKGRARAAEIGALDGVAQTLNAGGMFQVVIGPNVKDVFEDLQRSIAGAGGLSASDGAQTVAKAGQKKPNIVSRVLTFISSVFVPILPALAGAGLVSAVLAVLVTFDWVDRESQTYIVLAFMANSLFFFLPVLLAYSAAAKLGINRFNAVVVAGMMIHPAWNQLVAAGEPVSLFNLIPLTLATYSSTVVPVLLVIFVQSYFEKFLEKVIPNAVKIIVVPLLTFLVMGTLALALLGPIGSVVSGIFANGFNWLADYAPWASPMIWGGLQPVFIMFGLHVAIGPIAYLQLAQLGYDSLMGPGAICSNISMGIASGIVAIRTKELKFRQIASSASITAIMGITEPAIFGVLLPKRYPLFAAMAGGAAGGLYAGLTATRRFAGGYSGIIGLPMYIGDDTLQNFFNILIAIGIAIAVTAVVTVALAPVFERRIASGASAAQAALAENGEAELPVAAPVNGAVVELTSPCTGVVVPLSSVSDGAFSSGALGPGLGIEPSDGKIVAPCPGTIIAAMETGHAYGIRTDDGTDVLVHVGIDTVTLKGEGFVPAVRQGDRVAAGQLLVTVDLEGIAARGLASTVIVVVTDTGSGVAEVEPIAEGDVVAGEPVLRVRPAAAVS